MSDYKVKAWSWCADYCKKNQWNPHDSYFWDKAMLQYRRANNIFEVGDFVVFKTLGDGHVHKFSEFHEFKYDLRHAADAEIKAGKRL